MKLLPQEQAEATQARFRFQFLCSKLGLKLNHGYFDYLYQVVCWLQRKLATETQPKIVSISGAQGSGKSTLVKLLADQLGFLSGVKSLIFSLDDFYLTKPERYKLSVYIHPLLATRGVPGTHDIKLLNAVKQGFVHQDSIKAPKFDKALDDRSGETVIDTRAYNLLIFEGWCWGVNKVPDSELLEPINSMEKEEDAAWVWRRYVNAQIDEYQSAFTTDYAIFLQVPDFAVVPQWRWQQEQSLLDGPDKMALKDIERFVMHYERLTRRLLHALPGQVDLCLCMNTHHEFINLHVMS